MSQEQNDRYYAREELEEMKFRKLGQDVLISRTSRLYSPEYISIGDFSIVDDFCILRVMLKWVEMFILPMAAGLSGVARE